MPGTSVRHQKLEAVLADICLPDYWGGHHLPHVVVPIHKGISFKRLKEAIVNELSEGCVCGAEAPASNDDKWFRAARIAVGNIQLDAEISGNPDDFELFPDLDTQEDEDSTVYAYFVFTEEVA